RSDLRGAGSTGARLGGRPVARHGRRAEGGNRPQGQGAVPAAAPGAYRAGVRPRHGRAAAADRGGRSTGETGEGGATHVIVIPAQAGVLGRIPRTSLDSSGSPPARG